MFSIRYASESKQAFWSLIGLPNTSLADRNKKIFFDLQKQLRKQPDTDRPQSNLETNRRRLTLNWAFSLAIFRSYWRSIARGHV